ncbi:MAG TPA: PLP-dependent aminotransferase family protein [Lysobacter sp.]
MAATLRLRLDRSSRITLAEQIRAGILAAVESGTLAPGARLPSWLDLAAQLGVSRGTVKTAYERLADEQIIVAHGPGGSRVSDHAASAASATATPAQPDPLPALYQDFFSGPAIFQMGVPASDCFPASLFARLRANAARLEVAAPAVYPDPRGEFELRRVIAGHLGLARGIQCHPSQVFVTAGYAGALGLVLRVLQCEGRTAWMEDPGFFQGRMALELAGLSLVPVPVDEDGMDVRHAIEHAPHAALALVTPGQQAPLGATLSLARRVQLIDWAARNEAWVIEDDYLGELQLKRRAAPALASLDRNGRVVHIGSFSKTISPTLRLGFAVVPAALAPRFAEAAMCLAPAPGPAVQLATAEFMRDGHFMRHLRRMKRIYAARSEALQAALLAKGYTAHAGGLAVLLRLPEGTDDVAICREAQAFGLAPVPLSAWHSPAGPRPPGLLLGVSTAVEAQVPAACERLHRLIAKFG